MGPCSPYQCALPTQEGHALHSLLHLAPFDHSHHHPPYCVPPRSSNTTGLDASDLHTQLWSSHQSAAWHVIAPWVVAVCVCTARHDRERRRRRKCEHDEGAQRNQHHFVLRRSMVIAWMLPGLHPQVRNMRHTMTFPRRRMRAPGVKAQLAPPCLGDSNDPKRTAALPASASLHPADRAPSGPTHAEIYGSGRTWATPPCARAFRHPPAPRQPPAPRHPGTPAAMRPH